MKKGIIVVLSAVLIFALSTSAFAADQKTDRGNGQGAGFVDADNDGICDNRGTGRGNGQGAGFVDADNDGICDNRGTGCGNGQGAGNGCRNGAGRGMNRKK